MLEIQAALIKALDFYQDAERFGYDINFTELEFSKAKRNYERILKRLREITLPNPATFKYTTLTIEELKELLTLLLTKILGPEYKNQFEEYNGLLKEERLTNPFDSAVEVDIEKPIPKVDNIYISKEKSSIQVVSTGHEYIHALLAKYDTTEYTRVLSNIHYKELLSILMEYILCYELSQILKEDKLIEKHNVIRLSHNQEHAIEHEGTQDLEKMSRRYSFLLPDQLKLYMAYENHLSFGYITSDIYATQLFKYYQEDPKTALMYIKGIIDGEKSIKELLKHYNIALNNPETFATYNKRLDNIPKI